MIPVIDTHCHIYPEKIAEKASAGIGIFYDGIPVRHTGNLECLKKMNSDAGIKHSIIFSVATSPKQVRSINEFIADNVQNNPEMLTGLGALHPDCEDFQAEIDYIQKLGLKGVKLHHDIQQFAMDDPRSLGIFEACQGKLPVLLHCGDYRYDYSNPERMKKILQMFPRLQVIGAHMGGWSVWEEAAEILHSFDNFMVDTSSTLTFIDRERAKRVISQYAPEKVMFATDFPSGDAKLDLELFFALGLSEEDNEKILCRNAASCFGIQI